MRVPRYTNAYGHHSRSILIQHTYHLDGSSAQPTNGTYTLVNGKASRLTPVRGNRTTDGFRKPTQWGSIAAVLTTNSYSYRSKTSSASYVFTGTGTDPNHGVPVYSGYSASGSVINVTVSSNTVNRARVEALNKIKRQNINVGAALGESKTTVRMLAQSVSKLIKAYGAARRGRWGQAGQILGFKNWKDGKGASDGWLEYQYGWMPLISDIYGAQEQLKKGFLEKDQIFSVRREVKEALPITDLISNYKGITSSNTVDVTGKNFEICKTVYFQKVSNAKLLALNNLGLVNPASIAWELTPFSFVIDWVLPIGNFLDGLTATLGTTFIAGYEDLIRAGDIRWESNRYTFISGTKCKSHFRFFYFQRRILNSWPLPIPYWKNPFTSTHVVSALALLRQARK